MSLRLFSLVQFSISIFLPFPKLFILGSDKLIPHLPREISKEYFTGFPHPCRK